uniref:BPTI/Kunitz inhibitor domain-containing protein n=1 Tax=Leptobrachium leishanense TaxID=445787 RepID=A0A8C5R994_9ANUR
MAEANFVTVPARSRERPWTDNVTRPRSSRAKYGSQSPDQGPCRTYIIKWYYDKQANSCAQFWYGGCSGNGNRFDTEDECKKSCVSTTEGGETFFYH